MSNLPSPPPYHYYSCPPSFCSNPTKKPANMEKVDSLLLEIWRSSATTSIFTYSLGIIVKEFASILTEIIYSTGKDLDARAGQIQIFLDSYKTLLYKDARMSDRMKILMVFNFSASLMAEAKMLESGQSFTPNQPLDACFISENFESFQEFAILAKMENYQVEIMAWTIQELFSQSHVVPVTAELKKEQIYKIIIPIAREIFEITRLFMQLDTSVSFIKSVAAFGGNRLLVWSNLQNICIEMREVPDHYLPAFEYIKAWEEGVTDESMELLKLKGDELAKNKDYTRAIEAYQMAGELSKNVNARVNCAALRLRIAKDTDIQQFHLVVVDCTFALELEPNHVKALFRRGLALCKLKMWNEGIVDFERAIELDSRSPAVKELAWARRQVTRRLGA